MLERIGDARYVLIGEASHGTSEYYRWRAELTKRLLTEKDFSFVGVEGDWPDCYAVNCSVTRASDAPRDPAEALADFDRWPTWMWANDDVARFTRWLRDFNAGRSNPVGFYGLDVYSLWDSLRETLDYLRRHRPDQMDAAMEAFRCFEPFAEDPQRYARATQLVPTDCEAEVVDLLTGLLSNGHPPGCTDRDAHFNAEQNALVTAGAEAYYRAMVSGGAESWNVRDQHMFDTLDRLMDHYGPGAKGIVWEHNTHIGDARYTSMADAGMFNIGQLVRQEHGDDGVVLVGFGGYRGSVTAGDYWGGPTTKMRLPEASKDSTEAAMHEALPDRDAALFVFDPDRGDGPAGLDRSDESAQQDGDYGEPGKRGPRKPPNRDHWWSRAADEHSWARREQGHRAVGVVYSPDFEKRGNYVPTILDGRYDAFMWFNETTALNPLPGRHGGEGEMEAWPEGL
ncbi:MAG TPA: erythromycin esterase family protein [Arthrobacter sp.]|nr:erythromycin esterase family protein [Arthrobacter sp.]